MSRPPTERVLAEARRYLATVEVPHGSNRAVSIDYWLTEVGVPLGLPWCAAFVWNIGRQSLGVDGWPLPRSAGCQFLADWAKAHNLLVETPAAGDVFLLWETSLTPPRFGHTGFVTAVGADGVHTVEGNTNGGGSRDGYGVFERVRHFGPKDRFIRWAGSS